MQSLLAFARPDNGIRLFSCVKNSHFQVREEGGGGKITNIPSLFSSSWSGKLKFWCPFPGAPRSWLWNNLCGPLGIKLSQGLEKIV